MNFQNRFDQKYRNDPTIFGQSPMPILKKALNYVSSGKALDLGVGNGRNAAFLLSKSFEVTGVDVSEEGIKILRQKFPHNPKLKLIVADVLNFKTKEKYNLVCAIGLLHFLKLEDAKKLIAKMKKFTQNGGVNVIGARMTQNYRQDLPHVFKHNELKDFYTKGTWEIKHYEEINRGHSQIATLIAQKNKQRINL
jgi:tellurite methyltransferase